MPLNTINIHNPIITTIRGWVQGYNHEKYWRYRDYVTNPQVGGGMRLIIKYIRLFYIKRCDAKHLASTGTDINAGAVFKSHPKFPHGLNGIIISPYATIGKNAYIYHQVTIGDDGKFYKNVATIGDNVSIGAGAKIIGKVTIGNNVKIGAGAIVVEDVPDNTVVVGPKARIITK